MAFKTVEIVASLTPGLRLRDEVSKDDACLHFYWKTRIDTGEFWVVVTPTNFGSQRSMTALFVCEVFDVTFLRLRLLGGETSHKENKGQYAPDHLRLWN